MLKLAAAAAAENLPVYPLVADLDVFPLPSARYDAILNTTLSGPQADSGA